MVLNFRVNGLLSCNIPSHVGFFTRHEKYDSFFFELNYGTCGWPPGRNWKINGGLLFRVLPDLDERSEIIRIFFDHGVHCDIPVAEPAVDDHVRDFLFLETVEQVIRFGILGKEVDFLPPEKR